MKPTKTKTKWMAPKISKVLETVKRGVKRLAQAGLFSAVLSASEPVPAARPRVSPGRTFYPKTYAAWRTVTALELRDIELPALTNPVFVLIEVVRTKPKTSKLEFPRGDVDNFAKSPLDMMQEDARDLTRGFAWKDDNLVVGLAVFKRWAKPGEQAGFHISWMEVEID